MDACPLPQKMFVAFEPPKEVYAFHAAVQAAMASMGVSRKHHTPPHITVKAPIMVSQERADDIREVLYELVEAGKARRFVVDLGEIGMFSKSGAIYLLVDGGVIRPQMFHIIDAFAQRGFARGFYEGLVPHITLAKPHKWHRLAVRQMIEALDGRPDGRFMIDRLRIFTRHGIGSGEWDESESLRLW